MKQLLSDVLRQIRPSSREISKELELANGLLRRVAKNSSSSCKIVLTGSIAKKTFLRDKRDVDIFVLFDRSTPKEMLGPEIKRIMEATFPSVGYQMSYAEHPYVRFHYHGRRVDLVPAYKISKASQRISAVDRSILHTRFVRNSLKLGQTDEVLLLKQFLKSNSLYGAEIKIKGFSGYLCELLIIKYKTFKKLIQAAAKWGDVFIDIKEYYRPKEKQKAKKQFGQFVVIDPTDKGRNVAAAVSSANFKKFVSLCKKFIKKPSKQMFFQKRETFEQKIKKAARGKKLVTVSMPRPDIVDDVLWGQIYKLTKQLKEHLEDFEPKEILADDSKHIVRLAVILKKDRLPSKMLIEGPPLNMKKHIQQFRKSHKKAKFIKKRKKLYAEIKRPVPQAKDAVLQFFKKFQDSNSYLAYPEEMIIIG